MKSVFPTLVRAINPADLRKQIQQCLAEGKDLHTPMFVSTDGFICQFVVPSFCLYEYRLIDAKDLEDLEAQAHGLTVMGFDFMFNLVLWNGRYLQWMQRMNESGVKVKDAVVSIAAGTLLDNGEVDPDLRAQELTLVEDVQESLWLVSLRRRSVQAVGFSMAAPFPLAGSISKA